jgi:hypothetical protein
MSINLICVALIFQRKNTHFNSDTTMHQVSIFKEKIENLIPFTLANLIIKDLLIYANTTDNSLIY